MSWPYLFAISLIDRDAQIRAHGVSSRAGAGQQDRAARMVAAGLVVGGHRLRHVQAGDEHRAIAEWLQRLRDERELEVLAFLQRTPIPGRRAMRMPDADEALAAGAAAVRRSGVSAGTIDSSSGKASVTPAPRRNVRRGMCFFVMNIARPPQSRDRRRLIGSRTFVRSSLASETARS